jgi:hypothetical protein
MSQSAFTTTFQGQPPQEGNHRKKDYLYKELHHFKNCPYLVEDKRPTRWKADKDTQDRINSKLQKASIKAAVNRARAEAKKEQTKVKKDVSTPSTDEDNIIEDSTFATFTTIPK